MSSLPATKIFVVLFSFYLNTQLAADSPQNKDPFTEINLSQMRRNALKKLDETRTEPLITDEMHLKMIANSMALSSKEEWRHLVKKTLKEKRLGVCLTKNKSNKVCQKKSILRILRAKLLRILNK